jgi:hypothetical protein
MRKENLPPRPSASSAVDLLISPALMTQVSPMQARSPIAIFGGTNGRWPKACLITLQAGAIHRSSLLSVK